MLKQDNGAQVNKSLNQTPKVKNDLASFIKKTEEDMLPAN
jgi:hypothetical protein